MNKKGLILILVALTLSFSTILAVRSWLLNNQPVGETQVQNISTGPKIFVAKNDLPIGHIVKNGDFELVSWPDDDIPNSYLDEGSNANQTLSGSIVRHGIIAGEPITKARFVTAGQFGYMAAIINEGMRAVTIAVDRTSGLSGFIFPGDRVDLIVTHQIPNGLDEARFISETFLTNARVLAVDTRTNDLEGEAEISKTVTIEVTPAIAERINVVLRMGTISLSLRSISNPDGSVATALSRDQEKPQIPASSRTWDYEVSSILSPINSENSGPKVTVARGSNSQTLDIKGAQ